MKGLNTYKEGLRQTKREISSIITSIPITTKFDISYIKWTNSINFIFKIISAFNWTTYISRRFFFCSSVKFSNVGLFEVINDEIIVIIPGQRQLLPNNCNLISSLPI